MPFHLILQVIAFVLLLLAGFLEWPRSNTPPASGYGHPLAWFGLAAFVLAGLVP